MINGDVNKFVNNLYYGEEMNFSYNDKQYFIQGWIKDGIKHLELAQVVPVTKDEDYFIWKCDSKKDDGCQKNFLETKIFNGKTFWEVEPNIEWLSDWPIDIFEETKMYYLKHPEEKNSAIIDLTPKKISEMDEHFQNFVKKMKYGIFKENEYYNVNGEVLLAIEFLDWYLYKNGFLNNDCDWCKNIYLYFKETQ